MGRVLLYLPRLLLGARRHHMAVPPRLQGRVNRRTRQKPLQVDSENSQQRYRPHCPRRQVTKRAKSSHPYPVQLCVNTATELTVPAAPIAAPGQTSVPSATDTARYTTYGAKIKERTSAFPMKNIRKKKTAPMPFSSLAPIATVTAG